MTNHEHDAGTDAMPTRDVPAKAEAAHEPQTSPHGSRRWPGIAALLALLIAVAAGAISFGAWKRHEGVLTAIATLDAAQVRLSGEQTRLGVLVEELQGSLREGVQQQAAAQAAILARQSDLQDALESVRVFAAKGPKAWVLAEAEYLLRIADHQLRLRRDPAAAVTALEAANARLHDLADPALAPVRAALDIKIETLRTVPTPDIEGMALTLGELARQTEALPLRVTPQPATQAVADSRPSATEPVQRSWDEALDTTWAGLRRLVTIRHHDRPVDAVLAPKEQYFLRQGLRLRLEAARLALIQRYEATFRADLAESRNWIEQYFDADQPGTREMLTTLQRLTGTPISVPLPGIAETIEALRAATAALVRNDAADEDAP